MVAAGALPDAGHKLSRGAAAGIDHARCPIPGTDDPGQAARDPVGAVERRGRTLLIHPRTCRSAPVTSLPPAGDGAGPWPLAQMRSRPVLKSPRTSRRAGASGPRTEGSSWRSWRRRRRRRGPRSQAPSPGRPWRCGGRGGSRRAAAARPAPPDPVTISVSPSTPAATPLAARPAAVAARRSLSFTFSSARPCMTRLALGEGGDDREDRILVDHARRAPGRHGDAGEPAVAHADVGDRLAALSRARWSSATSAPISRRVVVEAGAGRVDRAHSRW